MKTTLIATTLAALLAGTSLAAAQRQPTYPPAQDYSQPSGDPQLQQEYQVPSSPVEDSRTSTTGQGRHRQTDGYRNQYQQDRYQQDRSYR